MSKCYLSPILLEGLWVSLKIDFALNNEGMEFLQISTVKWVWRPDLGLWALGTLFVSECFSCHIPNCISKLHKWFKSERNIIKVILGDVVPEDVIGVGGGIA